MSEYPKALYIGNKLSNDMVIADGLGQEQKYREAGYVDFIELTDQKNEVIKQNPKSDDELNQVKQELLDALKANDELQSQLDTLQSNFVGFRNDITAMQARIAEIQGDDTPAGISADYNEMTIPQLKALLTERKIAFKVNDTKPELIALLGG